MNWNLEIIGCNVEKMKQAQNAQYTRFLSSKNGNRKKLNGNKNLEKLKWNSQGVHNEYGFSIVRTIRYTTRFDGFSLNESDWHREERIMYCEHITNQPKFIAFAWLASAYSSNWPFCLRQYIENYDKFGRCLFVQMNASATTLQV